jgi:hypothetical protein
MIILMRHPQHGAMHVYDNGELARNRQYGWLPEDEFLAAQVPVINGDTEREPEDVIEEQSAAEVLKEALAESMRLDPPLVLPVVTIKRKPGRPRKAE